MTNSIVMEAPYAEMKPDSYDPSGWLNSMDIVCDGDREVCIVICTGKQSIVEAATSQIREIDWAGFLKRLEPHGQS